MNHFDFNHLIPGGIERHRGGVDGSSPEIIMAEANQPVFQQLCKKQIAARSGRPVATTAALISHAGGKRRVSRTGPSLRS